MKKLSKNEQLALILMAQGFKNREIAKQIISKKGVPLSEKTVSTYLMRAKQKMNIPLDKNTYFVVCRAIELGQIEHN